MLGLPLNRAWACTLKCARSSWELWGFKGWRNPPQKKFPRRNNPRTKLPLSLYQGHNRPAVLKMCQRCTYDAAELNKLNVYPFCGQLTLSPISVHEACPSGMMSSLGTANSQGGMNARRLEAPVVDGQWWQLTDSSGWSADLWGSNMAGWSRELFGGLWNNRKKMLP